MHTRKKQIAECLQQIIANFKRIIYRDFQLLRFFLRFSGFIDLFGKVFPINGEFLKFCEIRGSNVNQKTKQVFEEMKKRLPFSILVFSMLFLIFTFASLYTQ